jgi:hypothetical protein
MVVSSSGLREGSISTLDDSNDNSEKTEGTTKNFDDQNFNERVWVLGISDGTS